MYVYQALATSSNKNDNRTGLSIFPTDPDTNIQADNKGVTRVSSDSTQRNVVANTAAIPNPLVATNTARDAGLSTAEEIGRPMNETEMRQPQRYSIRIGDTSWETNIAENLAAAEDAQSNAVMYAPVDLLTDGNARTVKVIKKL